MEKNTFFTCITILLSVLSIFLYVDSKIAFEGEYLSHIAYGLIILAMLFLITYQIIIEWRKK